MSEGVKEITAAEAVSHTKEKLCQGVAFFYRSVLDTFLTRAEMSTEEKSQKIQGKIETLPPHLRPIVQSMWQGILTEAAVNYQTYKKDDQPISPERYLYGSLLEDIGNITKGQKIPDIFLKPDQDGKTQALFLFRGIPILVLRDDLYKEYLEITKMSDVGAFCHHNPNPQKPAFLCFSETNLKKMYQAGDNSAFSHELHHLLWHFLERSGQIRPANEASPEKQDAFSRTRNELVSYVLEKHPLLVGAKPEKIAYTKDKAILKETDETRRLVAFTAGYLEKLGRDPAELAYLIMSARNYQELNQKIIDYFPFSSPPNSQDKDRIQHEWRFYRGLFYKGPEYAKTIRQILDYKKIRLLPPDQNSDDDYKTFYAAVYPEPSSPPK